MNNKNEPNIFSAKQIRVTCEWCGRRMTKTITRSPVVNQKYYHQACRQLEIECREACRLGSDNY